MEKTEESKYDCVGLGKGVYSYCRQEKSGFNRKDKGLQVVKNEWICCPVCGNKTHTKLRVDTILKNFPLFCPKCKKITIIEAKEFKVRVVEEPVA